MKVFRFYICHSGSQIMKYADLFENMHYPDTLSLVLDAVAEPNSQLSPFGKAGGHKEVCVIKYQVKVFGNVYIWRKTGIGAEFSKVYRLYLIFSI